jgi:hypothetical protein
VGDADQTGDATLVAPYDAARLRASMSVT